MLSIRSVRGVEKDATGETLNYVQSNTSLKSFYISFQPVCNNIKRPGFQMTHQHFVWVHSGQSKGPLLCVSTAVKPDGLRSTREDENNSTFTPEVPYRVSSSKSCVWSGGKNFTTKRRMVFLGPEGREMMDREETVWEGGVQTSTNILSYIIAFNLDLSRELKM